MANIVLKPVDGALYKTIKPYMIENLAAFSKQSRSACEKQIDALLPDGEKTKKHYLYAIEIKSTCAADSRDIGAGIYADGDAEITVGYLWFFAVEKEGRDIAFLMDIFVRPEYRRKGIARKALRLAEKLLAEYGYDTVRLHVEDSNSAAKNLYAGLAYGFIQRAKNGEILEKRTDVQNKTPV
jgi:acetyltransferase, GNAT family